MLFFKKKLKFFPKKEKKPEKEKEKPETSPEQKLEEETKKASVEELLKQKPSVVPPKKEPQKLSKKPIGPAPYRAKGSDSGFASRILIRPIITEKTNLHETRGVYTFEIAPSANKISVKKAVEELYNVKPTKVRIIRTIGKQVRYGRTTGRTKSRKKAMVYLKKGDTIEFIKKI